MLADDYIAIVALAFELANSYPESTDSNADCSTHPGKIAMWAHALRPIPTI